MHCYTAEWSIFTSFVTLGPWLNQVFSIQVLHLCFFLRGHTLSQDQLTLKKQKKSHETDVFNILHFISYSIFPYTRYSRCGACFYSFVEFILSITIHNRTAKATKLLFYVNVSLQNVIYMIMMQSMTSKFLVFMKFEIIPSNPPLFYYRNIIQVSARSTDT